MVPRTLLSYFLSFLHQFLTMLDKRTLRSQNYKFWQRQQQQKLSQLCNVLPPGQYDLLWQIQHLAIYYLFLCSIQSPVSPTLLNIIQQFEQLAAHTTSTVAKYARRFFICPFVVIDPTDLRATTVVAPGLMLDDFLPIPDAESLPFYPSVLSACLSHCP